MKIAMLGPYPVNDEVNSINGGVQAVIVNLVKGLSRFSDLDIHIITASHSIKKDMDFKSNGVTVHAVPLDNIFGNLTLYSRTRKRLCRKIYEIKPDLVHAHSFGYCTSAALDSGHKRLIVSTHGIRDGRWYAPHNITDSIRAYLQHCMYYRCARRVKDIVINSPYARERLSGFKQIKMRELNNPVSDIFFGVDNSLEEEGRVLFVGNVCEAKGIMTMLEAMDILKGPFPEMKLIIAGPIASRDFYSKASCFIKERGLDDRINFLGHLDEDRLRQEYQKASIFAFPSRQDVAPIALLQAMATGKAIVASKAGGIPYIIDDGVNGFLIEKDNPNALADKIALFLKDSALRRKLGVNAIDKVSRENRISVVTEKLHNIYNEIEINPMKIEEVSDYKRFQDYKAEWEGLLSRSDVDNIFLTHDWIDSCIKHFYRNDRLLILNVSNGGRLVGIAPLVIRRDRYFGLPVKTISFIGTSISDRMDFILDGDKEEIIALIFDYLLSMKEDWDIIDLQEFPEYTGNIKAVERCVSGRGISNVLISTQRSFFINLGKNRDFLFQKFSKKLNRRLKKIKNKGIGLNLEFQRYADGDIKIEGLFTEAEAIEGRSWKGNRQSGIFSKKETRDFHTEILNRFSKNKWIDFSIVSADKKPVAYVYNYLYGNRIYNYSAAFDKKYSRISAGTMLMWWILKDSSSLKGVLEFDFARGEDSWKTRFTRNFRVHSRARVFRGAFYPACLYILQARVMPYMRRIKILHKSWMKIKDALRWG